MGTKRECTNVCYDYYCLDTDLKKIVLCINVYKKDREMYIINLSIINELEIFIARFLVNFFKN